MTLQENRHKLGDDGSIRKAHYGDGEQPWDIIKRLEWAPEFAAGNVLKYMRRTKDPEHSRESARWYYRALKDLTGRDRTPTQVAHSSEVYKALMKELTDAELVFLAM